MSDAAEHPDRSVSNVIVAELNGVFNDERNPPILFFVAGAIFGSLGAGYVYRSISQFTAIGLDLAVLCFGAACVCYLLGKHVRSRREGP